jgi:hypothetical protein
MLIVAMTLLDILKYMDWQDPYLYKYRTFLSALGRWDSTAILLMAGSLLAAACGIYSRKRCFLYANAGIGVFLFGLSLFAVASIYRHVNWMFGPLGIEPNAEMIAAAASVIVVWMVVGILGVAINLVAIAIQWTRRRQPLQMS